MRKFLLLVLAFALIAAACSGSNQDQTTYEVTVDYDKRIEDSVKEGDYYNRGSLQLFNSDNFLSSPRSSINTIELQLVNFEDTIHTSQVLKEFNKRCLRPATIEEFLAFGIVYSDFRPEFPIAALGSVVVGLVDIDFRDYVPVLKNDERGRYLELAPFSHRLWPSNYRFLVVSFCGTSN